MRLIDADRLKKKISDDAYRADSTKRYYNVLVEQQPTVEDAVVVVRCKDCAFYDEHIYMCKALGLEFPEDFYCARGCRRNGQ